jgi:hypothetical protein
MKLVEALEAIKANTEEISTRDQNNIENHIGTLAEEALANYRATLPEPIIDPKGITNPRSK